MMTIDLLQVEELGVACIVNRVSALTSLMIRLNNETTVLTNSLRSLKPHPLPPSLLTLKTPFHILNNRAHKKFQTMNNYYC